MFLDELGRLCLMDSRGTVTYLVATTTPPVQGALIAPPEYKLEPPVEPPPKLLEIPAPRLMTLWDHLKEDEPGVTVGRGNSTAKDSGRGPSD